MDKEFFKKLYDMQQSMIEEVTDKVRDSKDESEWTILLKIAGKMIDIKLELLKVVK